EKEYVRVVVEDDKGAVSADSTININVIGVADDVPAVEIIEQIEFKEDESPLTQTGVLDDVVGLTPDLSWNLVTGDGSYGHLTLDSKGNWTYVLDNDSLSVQQLNEGEPVTDTFRVTVVDKFGKTVVDENGDPVEMIFKVEVKGTNDAPEISGQLNGTISNIDSDGKISGKLNDGDVDTGDTNTWSVADNQGDYGRLVLINGKWTYTLDTSLDAVKVLGIGDTLTDTFEVTVKDAAGEMSTETVTVTIDGSNLPPEIAQNDQIIMELKEDETITDSKTLVVTDPNGDDITFDAKTLTGTYGTFTVDANGVWTYTLDNDDAHIQGLNEGEVVSEVFTVFAVDVHGAKTAQQVTVNIKGTNDIPKIAGMDRGSVEEADGSSTSGNFVTSDVDVGDNVVVSSGAQGSYGSVSVDNNIGRWTYTVDGNDPTVNSLSKGETLTDTVTIIATDDEGETSEMTITITINGENDAPDLVVTVPPELTEDSGVNASNTIEVTGNWDNGDPDTLDTHSWQVLSGNALGTLTLEPNGDYKLVVDNTALEIQQLGVGESLDLTYTVKVTDEYGLGSTQDIIFTVNGTNDDPEVVNTSVLSVDVAEDGKLSKSGQLDITDIDISDTTFDFSVITSPTNAYGSVTVDANGEWTYVLDNDKAQEIGDKTITETFTIQIDDGNGGVITQDVTVNITGTDDEPIIDTAIPQVTDGTVAEDGELHVEGTINYLDPEGTDVGYTVSTSSIPTYGIFSVNPTSGKWEYDLDNTLAQAIGADGAQESLIIDVTDATGQVTQQVITINITGENDSPVITGTSTADVKEGVVETVTGQLNATDIESDPITWQIASTSSATGTYGTLNINAAGLWTYVLLENSTLALAIDTTDEFIVEASDGKGGITQQVITVAVAVPNVIQGVSGSEILTGTANDELLFGNPLDLSDVGTADTFTWTNASIGGYLARDVIKDFDLNSDKIDLSDIADITTVWDLSLLASQIQITEVDGNTEIYINESGNTVQTIVVDGITLDELAGEPTGSMTDEEKLNALINSDHLVVSDNYGNDADNILYASGQNDILTGGGGNDIFYFADEIAGSSVSPAQTSIADFAVGGVAANNEADILDLAELLPDSIQANSTMEDMLQYIGVNIDDNNSQTVLSVTDQLGNQTDITLQGVDSTTLGISDLGSMSAEDILNTIYNNFNMFKVD
ncbi:MAG: type I secretion C-terminal target domain-containing protein, partial [Aliivibrio sp.]|nr:type I secretion C-terminal target domain-containing protein [Aliivibrio sp.]